MILLLIQVSGFWRSLSELAWSCDRCAVTVTKAKGAVTETEKKKISERLCGMKDGALFWSREERLDSVMPEVADILRPIKW